MSYLVCKHPAAMRLLELGILCRDPKKILQQLQLWKVIPTAPNYLCKRCGAPMRLGRSERDADGCRWFCTNVVRKNKQKARRCGTQVSVRTGTLFSNSQLPIFQIVAFISLWLSNLDLVKISNVLGIGFSTMVDWAAFCREVVLWSLIVSSEQLGGNGRTVEIDQCKFEKQKYDLSEFANGKAALGGYERETGRVFVVPIADDSAESIISNINEWIAPESTILSNCWRPYDFRGNENFKRLKVENTLDEIAIIKYLGIVFTTCFILCKHDLQFTHNVIFRDPDTHTNLESTGDVRKYSIAGNLAKCLFIKRCEFLKIDRVKEFLRLTGKIYDAKKDSSELKNEEDCMDQGIHSIIIQSLIL